MIGVMITNGGSHPPEKWAEVTASHIVNIADHVTGEKRGAAIKLQASIIEILEGHHSAVQCGERDKIQEHGHGRLCHELDPCHHLDVDEVVAEIIASAKDTPWEADFAYQGQELIEPSDGGAGQPYIASFAVLLKELLMQHFRTNMNIERAWHADCHPDTDHAKTFRSTHNVGE